MNETQELQKKVEEIRKSIMAMKNPDGSYNFNVLELTVVLNLALSIINGDTEK